VGGHQELLYAASGEVISPFAGVCERYRILVGPSRVNELKNLCSQIDTHFIARGIAWTGASHFCEEIPYYKCLGYVGIYGSKLVTSIHHKALACRGETIYEKSQVRGLGAFVSVKW
jgi:hypothetical protein